MKVFVDLSHTQLGPSFAFFDTIVDRFETFGGNQTWECEKKFIEDYDGVQIYRYTSLIPFGFKNLTAGVHPKA